VYPFQWQALWPLIGVSIARGQAEEALAYAEALLEPTQQLLPEELNAALQMMVRVKATDRVEAARPQINRIMDLAREMGYL
jgi:hypothetical protein